MDVLNRLIGAAAAALVASGAWAGASETTFTYQGELREGGEPAAGEFDMVFSLWDSETGGSIVAGPVTVAGVEVDQGRFAAPLDFGAEAFDGSARWLEVSVEGVVLSPRQPVTRTPYALQTRGIVVDGLNKASLGNADTRAQLNVASSVTPLTGQLALVDSIFGSGSTQADAFLTGWGVNFNGGGDATGRLWYLGNAINTDRDTYFVSDLPASLRFGTSGRTGDLAIDAEGDVGIGTTAPQAALHVEGPDNNGATAGLRIDSGAQRLLLDGNEIDSNDHLYLNNNSPSDVLIASGGGQVGVGTTAPEATLHVVGPGNEGITAGLRIDSGEQRMLLDGNEIDSNDHLYLNNNSGTDVFIATGGGRAGVRQVYNNVSFTVQGRFPEQYLFIAQLSDGSIIFQVEADRDVRVFGDFFVVGGTKSFAIDHPLDPANKTLVHNAVEGPGYYTTYHGTVTLGEDGTAWVELPDYFEALNTDVTYNLTCVGGYAPVYVGREVEDNRFLIEGGRPGLKVSWLIHASRRDPYAQDHPFEAERPKTGDEIGRYYYPEGYGQPPAQSIARSSGTEAPASGP